MAKSKKFQNLILRQQGGLFQHEAKMMAELLEKYNKMRDHTILNLWLGGAQQAGRGVYLADAAAMHSLEGIEKAIKDMVKDLNGTLPTMNAKTVDLARSHFKAQINEILPTGAFIPIPRNLIKRMIIYKDLLSKSYKNTMNRYGVDLVQTFRRDIIQGMVANWTPAEVANKLMDSLPEGHRAWKEWNKAAGGAKVSAADLQTKIGGPFHWAERFTRTEVINAYGATHEMEIQNAAEMAEVEGLPFVVQMEWVADESDRTCEECLSLDGEVRDPGEPFTEDITHPPVHPNCRCSIVPHITEN